MTKTIVKLDLEKIDSFSLAKLFDLIFEAADADAFKATTGQRYDCTKCEVAKDVRAHLFELAKAAGYADYSMAWCCYGPKANAELPASTAAIYPGFILAAGQSV